MTPKRDRDHDTCSECGASLEHRYANAITCSPYCKTKRSRRLTRAERHLPQPAIRDTLSVDTNHEGDTT